MTSKLFSKEVDLVKAYCAYLDDNPRINSRWKQYHETAGWDLLLVDQNGVQVGIEAKLCLNAKVLDQALPSQWSGGTGPDYRAVLVPEDALQNHLISLARHVGIVVITVGAQRGTPDLPDEKSDYSLAAWPNWCPTKRCKLPDYLPDVVGGCAAPLQLSEWKIKAIKLLILLEKNGVVTRADMKALQISPTRWTDNYSGFLNPSAKGYIRNGRTPDLKSQHPEAWVKIEADYDVWGQALCPKQMVLA